ncbi:MAG: PorT family protein [Chitinophagaceae bacterium]|nr:PorT family protein [Chitinophagaceae bacterium]
MKTKYVAFTILFLSLYFSSPAQIIKAGINAANISITNDGDIDKNNSLTSFQAGITGDIKIVPMFFFQPGLLISGKGSKTSQGDPNGATYYTATTNPVYVEIPANFVFKSPGPLRFFFGAGPYIAIGIAGKNKVDGRLLGTSFHSEENIEWSNDDPSTLSYEEGAGYGIMKRFDYGINATAGLQFTKIVLAVNYGHGLAKLQSGSESSADDENKHRVFSLTVGLKL